MDFRSDMRRDPPPGQMSFFDEEFGFFLDEELEQMSLESLFKMYIRFKEDPTYKISGILKEVIIRRLDE